MFEIYLFKEVDKKLGAKNHYENLYRDWHLTLFTRITCVWGSFRYTENEFI